MAESRLLFYVGNQLSRHGSTPTTIETLGPRLSQFVDLIAVSDKKNRWWRLWDITWQFLRKKRHIGVVLIDTYSTAHFWVALWVACLARWFHRPYVCFLHGGNLPARLTNHPGLSRWLFGGALQLISPSRYLQRTFGEYGFESVYLPNSIDLAAYPFRLRRHLKPRLLYVRAMCRLYHPTLLVTVLHLLKDSFPDLTLTMIGPDKDGSSTEVLAMARELGVSERITLTGRLEKEQWIRQSPSFDLFVNPTRFDNHPVSVIEAMALGFPIVSTTAGGLPDLLSHEQTALLVPPEQPEAFATAVARLLEDPDLAEGLSRRSRLSAERFDWTCLEGQWRSMLSHWRLTKT
jgi:glycosyltransferase involved in cell wall biosynthesis